MFLYVLLLLLLLLLLMLMLMLMLMLLLVPSNIYQQCSLFRRERGSANGGDLILAVHQSTCHLLTPAARRRF